MHYFPSSMLPKCTIWSRTESVAFGLSGVSYPSREGSPFGVSVLALLTLALLQTLPKLFSSYTPLASSTTRPRNSALKSINLLWIVSY